MRAGACSPDRDLARTASEVDHSDDAGGGWQRCDRALPGEPSLVLGAEHDDRSRGRVAEGRRRAPRRSRPGVRARSRSSRGARPAPRGLAAHTARRSPRARRASAARSCRGDTRRRRAGGRHARGEARRTSPPGSTDATRRRTEFEPTSMTATCTRGILSTESVVLPGTPVACAAAGALERAPHHRLVMRVRLLRLWPARRASHSPVGARIQALTSSASALSRIAWISARTRAFSTGHEHLDAVVEIALHEVGAADVRRDALVGLERVDAAVLEEAADDRADVDVLGHALDAGPERARRARDDVDPARPRATRRRAPRRSSGRRDG